MWLSVRRYCRVFYDLVRARGKSREGGVLYIRWGRGAGLETWLVQLLRALSVLPKDLASIVPTGQLSTVSNFSSRGCHTLSQNYRQLKHVNFF